MSDAHHEFCPKCGFFDAEKIQDGIRCHFCAQVTLHDAVTTTAPAVVCPHCNDISVSLVNPHHCAEYPVGHCKLFRCLVCEKEFMVKLSADEHYKVPPPPPSTVMLSSGIVLSVDEARSALEEVAQYHNTLYGDPAGRDDAMDNWLARYFPKSMDR